MIHTLPQKIDPRTVQLDCRAELTLRTEDGQRTLYLRRTILCLEESQDGETWRSCHSLASHGISPLDVQLSISAATVFGRRSLEAAPDTRHLLSMMLGFDALEELGNSITTLATNLTKAFNTEKDSLGQKRERGGAKIGALPAKIRDTHPLRAQLLELAGVTSPEAGLIEGVRDEAAAAVSKAESELAAILGIDPTEGKETAGLADALTAAVCTLGKPIEEIFPSLASLQMDKAFPEGGPGAGEMARRVLASNLTEFTATARDRIRDRLTWWRREAESGGLATLLVQAATFYDPESHECPVCTRPIEEENVRESLTKLKVATADLRATARVFFRDMTDEIIRCVPSSIRDLAECDPAARVCQGWEQLKKSIPPVLAPVVERYEAGIAEIIAGIPPVPVSEADLIPPDAEAAFREDGAGFVRAVTGVWMGMATVAWAVEHLPMLLARLSDRLTAPLGDPPSLYASLHRGKDSAADVTPVAAVRDELAAAAKEAKAICAAEGDLSVLVEMRTAIDELKGIGKYAGAEVEFVFEQIKGKTVELFGKLYPGANPDLGLSRLHMNTGRDRTVEAFLGTANFEVPGQHVANAGCLRAVALAFYFALLERHPGGLGFVVMDDPILSLDDNHREAWSANVLRPALSTIQVVVATHQMQFLSNCRADFRPGRLVALNSRRRSLPISWRPGERLDHADHLLSTGGNGAALEMRKYHEELLITLDAYSPTPLFNRKNLKDSLDNYAGLVAPHPLAGANQECIAVHLRNPKVARVLNASSHAKTEPDVTEPMVVECLQEMRRLDGVFRRELDRLDDTRLKELRGKSVSAPPSPDVAAYQPDSGPIIIPFDQLRIGDDEASWTDPLRLRILGSAAAQSRGCVVDIAQEEQVGLFPTGGAVLVAGDGLCPVMRAGQWALLADPSEPVNDGDYAAVLDQAGHHYLRRIWSCGDAWFLEAINPLVKLQPIRVRKCFCLVRKILGVSFGPKKQPKPGANKRINEWHQRRDFDPSALKTFWGITICGTSLEPLAGEGHAVIVSGMVNPAFDSLRAGMLAVVETEDHNVGSVIKRIHPGKHTWTLLSPNLLEPREPITVSVSDLRRVWPVRGILFDLAILDNGIE